MKETMNEQNYPEVIEEVVTEPISVEEDPVEEAPVPEEPKATFGTVVGCSRLNVRKNPSLNAKAICTIDANTKVEVDTDRSTSDFYKIYLADGSKGFCVKDYIKLI